MGSSSLREELFSTFLKAHGSVASLEKDSDKDDQHSRKDTESDKQRDKQERRERAVREREQKVRAERSQVEATIDRSRMELNKEEGDLAFRCAECYHNVEYIAHANDPISPCRTMLTDAIRDPTVWLLLAAMLLAQRFLPRCHGMVYFRS